MSKYGNTNVTDEEIRESQKGVADGVASLDGSGNVPAFQLGNAPAAPVYGQERFYVESLGLSTTSSAALVDKINTNTPALNPAHTYEVHWSCETNADLNYRRVQVQVVIGGITVSDASSETETQPDFQDRSGFLGSITGLTGVQSLTMRYSRNGGPGSVTVGIRQAKISLIRVA